LGFKKGKRKLEGMKVIGELEEMEGIEELEKNPTQSTFHKWEKRGI
jgi:hypothetical protein